jgi:hypothetical protein
MAARLAQYEQEILAGAAHRAAVLGLGNELTSVEDRLARALEACGEDDIKRAHVLRAWHTGRPFDVASAVAEGRELLTANGLSPGATQSRRSAA